MLLILNFNLSMLLPSLPYLIIVIIDWQPWMINQGTGLLAISTALPNLRPPPCNPALSDKCEVANNFQMGIFYLAIYLNAVGIGGIKSGVSGLGTDQFDQKDEKEKAQMAHFFDRFYFVINSGTLLAVTVLVYVQDQVGRKWAYGICSASMTVALFVFFLGTKRYRYKKRLGTPIFQIIQVLVAAVRKRKAVFPSNASLLYEDTSQESRLYHTDKFRYVTNRFAAFLEVCYQILCFSIIQ